MSGVITPLIDTLLHEVLGKRVDSQSARPLVEPVKPLSPGQAPSGLHSDSRLGAEHTPGMLPQARLGTSARPGTAEPPLTPASTTTHFSPAARSIADILLKFPAPPSVVKPQAPLLEDGAAGNAPVLATRLQHSIESSGLFYESHLARWYRGDMSRSALEREPQMLFHALRLPTARTQAADHARSGLPPLGGTGLSPAPAGGGAPAPLAPLAGAAASGQGGASEMTAGDTLEPPRPVSSANGEAMDESLQGIVRHQLELLVTPTLRWEGDVWSSVFMALVVHIPEVLGQQTNGEQQEPGEEDEDPVWHSQLNLRLPQLGAIDVQLHLRTAALSLALQSESEACVKALDAGREALVERLCACGFDEVRVSVLAKQSEPEDEQ